jgi:cysteine synthase A
MKYHSIISSTIGSTPLVQLNRITEEIDARIFAKLEFHNPLGSVKDRIAASMIETAEVDGLIDPQTFVLPKTTVFV